MQNVNQYVLSETRCSSKETVNHLKVSLFQVMEENHIEFKKSVRKKKEEDEEGEEKKKKKEEQSSPYYPEIMATLIVEKTVILCMVAL